MKFNHWRITMVAALIVLSGDCSSDQAGKFDGLGGAAGHGSGGATGAGGSSSSGAAQGSGGAEATGGKAGTGAQPGTGGSAGARGSGGVAATGGTIGSGGRAGAGGADTTGTVDASAFGGTIGLGDASATGGTTVSLGGQTGQGGAKGSGGATGLGGQPGTGGVGATGGTTASGGATGSGGSTVTGGAKGTGGVPGTGGTTGPVTLSCPGAAPAGITPDWCSCEQWGQWTKGDATYYNDIWGSGAGPQCIWVAGDQWGVAANHPSGGSVKSYPNISFSPGKALSAFTTYTSNFAITVPSGGAWEVAYDIWVQNGSTQIEIMLWVNYTKGVVFPASSTSNPAASNVTTGGHAWDVYYGGYGGQDVISLLRTTNTTSATVDLKDIFTWLITNKKTFNTSWTLYQVQFGPEIVSDSGVQSFVTNSFSVSSS